MKSRDEVIQTNMEALARRRGGKWFGGKGKKKGKKKGSARSLMLRMIMPLLSRENGEKLASAIDSHNTHLVREVMGHITHDLVTQVQKYAAHASAADPMTEAVSDLCRKELVAMIEALDEGGDMTTTASGDMSRALIGNGTMPTALRRFIAEGSVDLEGKGGSYKLALTNVGVVSRNRGKDPHAVVKYEAVLIGPGGSTRILDAKGKPVEACNDIVTSAMSLISQ